MRFGHSFNFAMDQTPNPTYYDDAVRAIENLKNNMTDGVFSQEAKNAAVMLQEAPF